MYNCLQSSLPGVAFPMKGLIKAPILCLTCTSSPHGYLHREPSLTLGWMEPLFGPLHVLLMISSPFCLSLSSRML